ncbi:hypothetical protein G6F61_014984 [Rhizopus arrhizus]|nr:hypothetical protein G6F61_014984 [Rhizopus arrhizus]
MYRCISAARRYGRQNKKDDRAFITPAGWVRYRGARTAVRPPHCPIAGLPIRRSAQSRPPRTGGGPRPAP